MKTAVILLNLGGPDKLASVRPFLFNLFNDKAIIGLPQPFRWLLAHLISGRRNVKAQEIYKKIGGSSPLLKLTMEQAVALETSLGEDYKVFVCMRYWHPRVEEVVAAVRDYAPDEIVLLPLYPQYSTTTTGSSFRNFLSNYCHPSEGWDSAARLSSPSKLDPSLRWDDSIRMINFYHLHPDFIAAHVDLLRGAVEKYPEARVLFSAHGLPEKVIAKGDPYQKQIEESSAAIAEAAGLKDWRVCYQSKVGPLPWLKPNTTDEIIRAGKEGKDVIVVPVSFVSEHSETLVELDIDFQILAGETGVRNYIRIPALGTHPLFIKALADLASK